MIGFLDACGVVGWALLALAAVAYALLTERALALASGERGDPERRLAVVRALIACAPLLGLLGTVGGLVEAFAGLVAGDRAATVGPLFGRALGTTRLGLAIAVPGLVAERLLSRWATRRARP